MIKKSSIIRIANNLWRQRMQRHPGVGLIEVLVAVFIIGVCLTGYFSLLQASSESSNGTNLREQAMNYATAEIEYLKDNQAVPYVDYATTATYTLDDLSASYPTLSAGIAEIIYLDSEGTPSMTEDSGLQMITVVISQAGEEYARLQGVKNSGAVANP